MAASILDSYRVAAAACSGSAARCVPCAPPSLPNCIDRLIGHRSSEHDMPNRPRRANLKPPGKCIFCGGRGLTKEHMWADWLRPYIPREMQEHRSASSIFSLTDVEEVITRRTGDPHA